MHTFLLIVQGDDTFEYSQEIPADTLELALVATEDILKSLAKQTIEQFKSVTIAKLDNEFVDVEQTQGSFNRTC